MVISFVCLWLLCSRGRGALPGLTRALILWNLELTAITERGRCTCRGWRCSGW